MFNPETLETSEFYNHRFKNFATHLLVPAAIALVAALLFLIFAQREITITSTGELTPLQAPVSVQATAANRIITNHLKEGKFVRQGEPLVTYHDVANPEQAKVYQAQVQQYQDQLTALNQYKKGLTANQDVFTQDDAFGYRQALQDYLSQRQIYVLDAQQVSGTQATANDKTVKVNQMLQQSIQTINRNIAAYQKLLTAVQNKSGYPDDQPFSYLYQSFVAESTGLDGSDLAKLKTTYTGQISEKLDAEQQHLDSFKLQQANNANSDVSHVQLETDQQKMAALQAEQLKSVTGQITQTNQSLTELKAKLTTLQDQATDSTLKAPTTGVLHLDDSLRGKKYLPSGTTLAEIYPVLQHQKKVALTLMVIPNDITSIKKSQNVRLKIARHVPVPLVLNGKVTQIDSGPTVTKDTNVFKVTAQVNLTPKQARTLRYGLAGEVSIITGKKTYWNFLKDQLLNKS